MSIRENRRIRDIKEIREIRETSEIIEIKGKLGNIRENSETWGETTGKFDKWRKSRKLGNI